MSWATSSSVRYSLGRYSAFALRRSVRFTAFGVSASIGAFSFIPEPAPRAVFVNWLETDHYDEPANAPASAGTDPRSS